MNRYAGSLTSVVARLQIEPAGFGLLIVPPTEHGSIADALQAELHFDSVATLGAFLDGDLTARAALIQLGPAEQRAARIRTLNSRRDFLATRGRLIVLLADPGELVDVQFHAPDLYSTCSFVEKIPFAPNPDIDPRAAREDLARYLVERLGRIDLRGFVRSESEDVSFRVEDLYLEAKASLSTDTVESESLSADLRSVPDWIADLGRATPVVILGHPGSGKSFLLRWLALHASRETSFLGVSEPLPALISVTAYARSVRPRSLLDYAVTSFLEAGRSVAHVLRQAATEGRVLLLLDGLDEVADEEERAAVREEVWRLHAQFPGCPLILTSRIVGYEHSDAATATELMLAPFDEETVQSFLVRWCELYAMERLGRTELARSEGKAEGVRLARDVLRNPSVLSLARNPLMLTVLAIVYRAGVRLPDHRVELYDHATRILVERWNRVRSLHASTPAPPSLKSADAVRLLGPLALRMLRSGTGNIDALALHVEIETILLARSLRGLATAEEAIELFTNTLGLLVEQAPGLFGFLHLTLAEYFAAWEIVRSGEIEVLAADEMAVFRSSYREVVLLGAAILGILRADDGRLETLVRTVLESSRRKRGRPSTAVPALLAGFLADDPGLTGALAQEVIDELVPKWWFNRRYGRWAHYWAIRDAILIVQQRVAGGPFGAMLQRKVAQEYGGGHLPDQVEQQMHASESREDFWRWLFAVGVDYGEGLLKYFEKQGTRGQPIDQKRVPVRLLRMDVTDRVLVCSFEMSLLVHEAVHRDRAYGTLDLFVWIGGQWVPQITWMDPTPSDDNPPWRTVRVVLRLPGSARAARFFALFVGPTSQVPVSWD